MKYLKYFETDAAYASYKNGSDYVLPNVSYVLDGSKLFYNPYYNLKNGTIYATFNATSDNMVAIYDTSNVKSLIVDDKQISFDITEGSTIINIIGENITMNDDMQTGTFPEEYCYMLSNGLPSLWTFKPTNASIDECNYIALIAIVSGQMMVSPMPINTGIEQGFFTYDDINNVFCVSESLLGQMSQGGIEGLNFACVKMDEVNGTFTFLDTTHDIKFRSGGKPIKYVFYNEGNHTMEIELIDDTIIPREMFNSFEYYNNSCITTITIPDSVTSIGNEAFYNCTKLTSVTIGNSVTSIGDSTFMDCTSLAEVIIGTGVTTIGQAFYGCKRLTSITCLSQQALSIQSNVFQNVALDGTLYVPAGSDYSSWMSTDQYYLGYYNWTIEYI